MIAGDAGEAPREDRPPPGHVLLSCARCGLAQLATLADPCTGRDLAELPRRLHRGAPCPQFQSALLTWPDGSRVFVTRTPGSAP